MTPLGPLKNQDLGKTAEIQEEPVSDCSLNCSSRIILQQGCKCWHCPTITLSVRGGMGLDQLHVPAIHSRFVSSCDRLDFQRARPRTAMSTLDVQPPITTYVFVPSRFFWAVLFHSYNSINQFWASVSRMLGSIWCPETIAENLSRHLIGRLVVYQRKGWRHQLCKVWMTTDGLMPLPWKCTGRWVPHWSTGPSRVLSCFL